MAATVVNSARLYNRKITTTLIEVAAYATGGVAVTPNQLGLTHIDAVLSVYVVGAGYLPTYNPAAGKVLLYVNDADAQADGPLIEAANSTNISTLDIYVTAIGR